MVSLLHPSLLPWLLAASIPLVIHLLTRRTRRNVPLPTVRFVQRATAQQSNLFRWRHFLLLLLRLLAVACLVVGFTKPTWNSPLGISRSGRTVVVLILDTSASMGYNDSGTTALSRAKSEAQKVLAGLGPTVQANVILCGAQPQAVVSTPTQDQTALQKAIRNAEPTPERADPNAALNLAAEQMQKSGAPTKRLYIFSDFQRSNWADVKFDSVPADAKIAFVGDGSSNQINAGVTAMRLIPAVPHIGEPISVECEIFNSSGSPRTLPVTLALSTGKRQVQNVSLEPFSSATANFTLQFDTPQRVECTASVPSDNLTDDDTRRMVIDLQHTAVVVLITDENTAKPSGASFFLAHALHPNIASASGFRVIPVKPAALNNPTLHAADAVIVCDAPQMPPAQFQALSRYAADGGNLLWFLYGDKIADQMTALGRQLPPTEPMPLQVDHVVDLAGNGKGYVTLAEAHYDSPLLKAFKDPAAADLTQIHFHKICVTGEVDPRAETLLKFDDGTSAVVHTIEGSGNLLLINMSPDPGWSDLARQPAFLPLMHEFLKGLLSGHATGLDFVAGGSGSATIPPDQSKKGARIACAGPVGPVPVTVDITTGSVVIDRVAQNGFYHVTQNGTPIATFAVNTHADETDLRTIDPRELESQRQRQSSYLAGMSHQGTDLDSMTQGRPLWQYLLVLALLCLFGEQWLTRLRPKVRPG